jgi:hypothetical protein
MSWLPIDWARGGDSADRELLGMAPVALRAAGQVVRAVFIVALLAITIRVSMPQNETIWTAYDSPGDLVRVLLGFVVCVWIASQLFWAPKDQNSYRTWMYFGFVAVPFAVLCLVTIW